MDELIKQDKQKKQLEEESKRLILGDISQKIKTTMIGSLDAIEKTFSSYFVCDELKADFLDKFREVRKRILDLGNEQILKVSKELDNYDIECKNFKPTNLVKRK